MDKNDGIVVDYKALGQRVRKVRLLREMTQEQVAEKADVVNSYVGVIERAEKKASINTLVKISNALNCSVDYLLGDSLVCGEDRVFDLVIGSKAREAIPTGDMASLRNLLPLLSGSGNREQEIKLILQILDNITAYYKDKP
jgi:transcriptional regulator with XRE-family HTH domain